MDATGATIPVIGTVTYPDPTKVFPYLLVADSNGLIWPVNPTTAIRFGGTPLVTPTLFSGTGCTGSPYAVHTDVLPGFVFVGVQGGVQFAAVPPGSTATMVTTASRYNADVTCSNVSFTGLAYPVTFLSSSPSPFFTPPARAQFIP